MLGSGAALLGSKLMEVVTTPIWRWSGIPVLSAAEVPSPETAIPVTYVDVAKEAGLNTVNVWGGVNEKKYIIEAKGKRNCLL